MPIRHVVEEGECLSSLAKRFGFRLWRTIYDDPANAALRQARPDPNVLAPGDVVIIPDKEARSEAAATGARHTYFVATSHTMLRIVLADIEPRRYRLTVEGDVFEGAFPASGLIERAIRSDARTGQLAVWFTDDTSGDGLTWDLDIGALDPVDHLSGVKARLNNLGYAAGAEDETQNQDTSDAVSAFQAKHDEPATGDPDPAFRERLRQAHDVQGTA
jgi:N-acetylmuramoyl-L-alanine amidase